MAIVLDTSVIVDMLVSSRPRHLEAQRLARYLQTTNQVVKVPYSALFEISSAARNERINSPGGFTFAGLFTEQTPLSMQFVEINQEFFERYFSLELPYMKAGDLLFVAMAKADGSILVTEDNNQYQRAREAGVQTLRIGEFLALVEDE